MGLGMALPVWDRDGVKIPGAWNGDEPRRKTFVAWEAFLANRAVYPSGGTAPLAAARCCSSELSRVSWELPVPALEAGSRLTKEAGSRCH